jgi:hypothetical protein
MKSSVRGLSLVELLISTALGMMLVLVCISLLVSVSKNHQAQQNSQMIYDEAISISRIWQQAFATVGDLGCLQFQASAQIQNNLSRPLLTSSGIKIYPNNDAALKQILPSAVIKKLLPDSSVIISENIMLPFYHLQYDADKSEYFLLTNTFKKGDEVLLSNHREAQLLKLNSVTRQKDRYYLSLPIQANSSWRIAHWQTNLWFVMKNESDGYGMYRLTIPDETAPVELVRDISGFYAKIDFAQKFLQAQISFAKGRQKLTWPLTIAFSKAAFGWRSW